MYKHTYTVIHTESTGKGARSRTQELPKPAQVSHRAHPLPPVLASPGWYCYPKDNNILRTGFATFPKSGTRASAKTKGLLGPTSSEL